jgi:hypothetical protein
MSGEITITPGYVFNELGDKITLDKLNKLVADAVARVLAGSITARELADGAISADKVDANFSAQLGVADGSITSNKIVNAAVTNDKLAGSISEDKLLGNIPADKIAGLSLIPRALVCPFAVSTAPEGWLACNGDVIPIDGTVQGVDASELQELRVALGTTYGAAGKLPDLRGEFLRGWDDGRMIDPVRIFGSSQPESFRFPNLASNMKQVNYLMVSTDRSPLGGGLDGVEGLAAGSNFDDDGASSVARASPNSGPEIRPRNVALLFCIKY